MNRVCFYRLITKPLVALQRRRYLTVPSPILGSIMAHPECKPFTLLWESYCPDVASTWINPEKSFEILGPGMILLRNFITLQRQADMVNICQKLGVCIGGFYEPRNPSGDILRLHMTCFGRNWDPVTRYENPYRSDGSDTPRVPSEFVRFSEIAIKHAIKSFPNDDFAFLRGQLASIVPDVCVVNYYTNAGRLGLHQDRDESSDSLTRGLPVISVSIGDAAEFWYGHTRDENKLEKVILRSGDVLIFGGKSRHIFHGVKAVYPMSTPLPVSDATKLVAGRLNLTLRNY